MQILSLQAGSNGIHAYSPLADQEVEERPLRGSCCWKLWHRLEQSSLCHRALGMVLFFVVWFGAGLLCCTTSTEIVRAKLERPLSIPFLLGLCQSLWMFICAFIEVQVLTQFSNYSFPSMKNPRLWPMLWKMACVLSVGYICLNHSLLVMRIPMLQTIRIAEPVLTVLLLHCCLPDLARHPLKSVPLCALLLLSTSGGLLFFGGQQNFSVLHGSFLLTALCSVLFSISSIVYKQIQSEFSVDAMALFYQISKLSVVINLCFFLAFDGKHIGQISVLPEMLEGRMPLLLFLNGVAFFAATRASLLVLHRVPVESHAIGNGLQRTFTVFCFLGVAGSVGVPIQPSTIASVVVALMTLFLYVTHLNFSHACGNSGSGGAGCCDLSGDLLPQQQQHSSASYALLQEQFTQAQARQKQRGQEFKKLKDSSLSLELGLSDSVKVNVMTTSPLYISGKGDERIVATKVGDFEMIM